MCVYCEVNEKGKRKKLFKRSQRIGSKGKLKSEAIIRKRKGPNKYFISASSWTGTYVHLLGEVICNFCPVCGRLVNPGKFREGDTVKLKKDNSTWNVAFFKPNDSKPYKLEAYGDWLEVKADEIELYEYEKSPAAKTLDMLGENF